MKPAKRLSLALMAAAAVDVALLPRVQAQEDDIYGSLTVVATGDPKVPYSEDTVYFAEHPGATRFLDPYDVEAGPENLEGGINVAAINDSNGDVPKLLKVNYISPEDRNKSQKTLFYSSDLSFHPIELSLQITGHPVDEKWIVVVKYLGPDNVYQLESTGFIPVEPGANSLILTPPPKIEGVRTTRNGGRIDFDSVASHKPSESVRVLL